MSILAAAKRPLVATVVLLSFAFASIARAPTGSIWSQLFAGSWTWDAANTHADNLVEGGFSDWRLPTRADLHAAINGGALPPLDPNYNYLMWTSDTKGQKAWTVRVVTDANGAVIVGSSGEEVLILKSSFVAAIATRP